MHDAGDLGDLAFEHAESGRVRQHDACRCRAHSGLQCVEVDVAVRIARDLLDRATAHCSGGGIGAMGGLRHDDFRAPQVVSRAMVGTNHGDPGKLALCAGHGSEAHGLHAGDFPQHLLQLVHAGQVPLRLGSERVSSQEFGQHGEAIACLGVVFHGA